MEQFRALNSGKWPLGHFLSGDDWRMVDRIIRISGSQKAQSIVGPQHNYEIEVVRADREDVYGDAVGPNARAFMFHFGGEHGSMHFSISGGRVDEDGVMSHGCHPVHFGLGSVTPPIDVGLLDIAEDGLDVNGE